MQDVEQLFLEGLKRGKFFYVPGTAWQKHQSGEWPNVVFLEITGSFWKDNPALPNIVEIAEGRSTLFDPDLTDFGSLCFLEERFPILQGRGFVGFPDGSVAEFLSTPVRVGIIDDMDWKESLPGRLVVLQRMFSSEEVAVAAVRLKQKITDETKKNPALVIELVRQHNLL